MLFKKYDGFTKNDYIELAKYCKKKRIDFLSTPFDEGSVDFLDPYLKFYKVASADLTNFPLLKKISSKNKPIILSIGASTLDEIKKTIKYLKKNRVNHIILLHCILNYPTKNKNANLEKINLIKKIFKDNIIGYSDHTIPDETMSPLIMSTFYGSKIIEKHFTFNKKLKGNDHYHAMDINDLKKFKSILHNYKTLNGVDNYDPKKLEKQARLNARRSIVIKYDLRKNTIIKEII